MAHDQHTCTQFNERRRKPIKRLYKRSLTYWWPSNFHLANTMAGFIFSVSVGRIRFCMANFLTHQFEFHTVRASVFFLVRSVFTGRCCFIRFPLSRLLSISIHMVFCTSENLRMQTIVMSLIFPSTNRSLILWLPFLSTSASHTISPLAHSPIKPKVIVGLMGIPQRIAHTPRNYTFTY